MGVEDRRFRLGAAADDLVTVAFDRRSRSRAGRLKALPFHLRSLRGAVGRWLEFLAQMADGADRDAR